MLKSFLNSPFLDYHLLKIARAMLKIARANLFTISLLYSLNQTDEKKIYLANHAMAKQNLFKVNSKSLIPIFKQLPKFSNYQKVLVIRSYQNFWNNISGMSGNTTQPHRNSRVEYLENIKFLILVTTKFQNLKNWETWQNCLHKVKF